MVKRQKYSLIQLVILMLCALFLILGIYLFRGGLFHTKIVSLKYKENDSTSYKVYLKENDFFETPFLEAGNTYITSLIDHIQIDYNYIVDFDHDVSGEYTYHIVATIEANKTDNKIGNYWTKDYNLTSDKTVRINNANHYSIIESIDIDYQKYNETLNYFKRTLGLSDSDGVLKVKLISSGKIASDEVESPIKSELVLKVPLSQLSIEASIDSGNPETIKVISKTVEEKGIVFKVFVALGSLFILAAIGLMVVSIKVKMRFDKDNYYDNTLRKIIATYDSIIVNVKELPDMKDYSVINVESFEEMIDAHSEVRMPINYYHTDNESIFLLYSNKTVWKYILKNEMIKGVQDEKK